MTLGRPPQDRDEGTGKGVAKSFLCRRRDAGAPGFAVAPGIEERVRELVCDASLPNPRCLDRRRCGIDPRVAHDAKARADGNQDRLQPAPGGPERRVGHADAQLACKLARRSRIGVVGDLPGKGECDSQARHSAKGAVQTVRPAASARLGGVTRPPLVQLIRRRVGWNVASDQAYSSVTYRELACESTSSWVDKTG